MGSQHTASPGWGLGSEGRAWASHHQGFSSGHHSNFKSFGAAAWVDSFVAASARTLSSADRAELLALSQEKDSEMFFAGILAFGQRVEAAGNLELAAAVYSHLLNSPLQNHAQRHLDAISGRGSAGLRGEVLLRGFTDAATDYRMIVPMLAGTVVGQLTQATLLGRLSGTARASWLTRGTGALAMSRAGGFVMEVHAFAGLGHLLSGSQGSFGQHLQGAGITLGAMKVAGWGINRMGKAGIAGQGSALQALGQFGGLLAAHRIEVGLGWRPEVDGATTVTDSVASLISLGVGAHLGHRALGPRFAAFQREMALRADPNSTENRVPIWNSTFGREFALARPSGPARFRGAPETFALEKPGATNQVLMSKIVGEGNGSTPQVHKISEDYFGVLIETEVVSGKPIHNLPILANSMRQSLLDILAGGKESHLPLKGELAAWLRASPELQRDILGYSSRVVVRLDATSGKILAVDLYDETGLKKKIREIPTAESADRKSEIQDKAPQEKAPKSEEAPAEAAAQKNDLTGYENRTLRLGPHGLTPFQDEAPPIPSGNQAQGAETLNSERVFSEFGKQSDQNGEWQLVLTKANEVWKKIQILQSRERPVKKISEAFLAEINDWVEMLRQKQDLPPSLALKYLERWNKRLDEIHQREASWANSWEIVRIFYEIQRPSVDKNVGNFWTRPKTPPDRLPLRARNAEGEFYAPAPAVQYPTARSRGPLIRQPKPRPERDGDDSPAGEGSAEIAPVPETPLEEAPPPADESSPPAETAISQPENKSVEQAFRSLAHLSQNRRDWRRLYEGALGIYRRIHALPREASARKITALESLEERLLTWLDGLESGEVHPGVALRDLEAWGNTLTPSSTFYLAMLSNLLRPKTGEGAGLMGLGTGVQFFSVLEGNGGPWKRFDVSITFPSLNRWVFGILVDSTGRVDLQNQGMGQELSYLGGASRMIRVEKVLGFDAKLRIQAPRISPPVELALVPARDRSNNILRMELPDNQAPYAGPLHPFFSPVSLPKREPHVLHTELIAANTSRGTPDLQLRYNIFLSNGDRMEWVVTTAHHGKGHMELKAVYLYRLGQDPEHPAQLKIVRGEGSGGNLRILVKDPESGYSFEAVCSFPTGSNSGLVQIEKIIFKDFPPPVFLQLPPAASPSAKQADSAEPGSTIEEKVYDLVNAVLGGDLKAVQDLGILARQEQRAYQSLLDLMDVVTDPKLPEEKINPGSLNNMRAGIIQAIATVAEGNPSALSDLILLDEYGYPEARAALRILAEMKTDQAEGAKKYLELAEAVKPAEPEPRAAPPEPVSQAATHTSPPVLIKAQAAVAQPKPASGKAKALDLIFRMLHGNLRKIERGELFRKMNELAPSLTGEERVDLMENYLPALIRELYQGHPRQLLIYLDTVHALSHHLPEEALQGVRARLREHLVRINQIPAILPEINCILSGGHHALKPNLPARPQFLLPPTIKDSTNIGIVKDLLALTHGSVGTEAKEKMQSRLDQALTLMHSDEVLALANEIFSALEVKFSSEQPQPREALAAQAPDEATGLLVKLLKSLFEKMESPQRSVLAHHLVKIPFLHGLLPGQKN